MKQNLGIKLNFSAKWFAILLMGAGWLGIAHSSSLGKSTGAAHQTQYSALRLSSEGSESSAAVNRYGVPFITGTLPFKDGSAQVGVGGRVRRIFLLGMTGTGTPNSWTDLSLGYRRRFFIGDELGKIRLSYADGSAQVFPLVLGESLWRGKIFYDYPEPFESDVRFRKALQKTLRLYPQAPVQDGNYLAVIVPRNVPIKEIIVENSSAKIGVPVIAGITVEPLAGENIANGIALSSQPLSPDFAKFAAEKPLRALGADGKGIPFHLDELKRAFYLSDEDSKSRVAQDIPPEYSGPRVTFAGSADANILSNVFHYNVQDMVAKIGGDGMYHTSTKNAANWSRYVGFGSYRKDVGRYYDESWTRDMGRSLQELAALGYANDIAHSADYCLRTARLWEQDPSLKVNDRVFPAHWGRIANKPDLKAPYENDGHGLTAMFLYRLWQRLPNRDEWLRSRWPDVKAAGDWILWQFDHPEISGAKDGVLHTTGESAAMDGYSVYADYVSMQALLALAQMADSIGEVTSAGQWRERAEKMRKAMADRYIINDPKYGRVWTLEFGGWPNKNTVLGPLIFLADYQGFAPEDDDPGWRKVNEASYQRLVDTYKPFGFYGQAMGYGQGFVTQSALLLDRMHDAGQMLGWAAKEIYDPRFGSYIVPEACDIDPAGRFWYRIGDLGNGVQEAEIVKALRLVIGVDDTQPSRLRLFPRMPYGWSEIAVEKYPVLFEHQGKLATARLRYKLERSGGGMKLTISSDQELGPVAMRLGPFDTRPNASNIRVNGQVPAAASVEHSGDSWWVKFTVPVGN